MTMVAVGGAGLCYYDDVFNGGGISIGTSSITIDASTEKAAVIGQIYKPGHTSGTFNIRKVGFTAGTATMNASSVFRVSLQDIDPALGPCASPDGVADQSYDYAGSGITANSWNWTGNLSSDRTVSNGDAFAVVFEFTTFVSTNDVRIQTQNSGGAIYKAGSYGYAAFNSGAAWGAQNNNAIIAFECDDGSYAFMQMCLPMTNTSNTSVASNGAVREAGLRFTIPFDCILSNAGLGMLIANNCDGEMILYAADFSTVLATQTLDNDVLAAQNNNRLFRFTFGDGVTLTGGTTYVLAFKGTTTTSATIPGVNAAANGLFDGWSGGKDMYWTEKSSSGTVTNNTERRPYFELVLSHIDIPTGGGGGLSMPISGRICA